MLTRRGLAVFAGVMWTAVGLMLLTRSVFMVRDGLNGGTSPGKAFLLVGLGLVIGAAKGLFVLSKTADRHLRRIDTLPEPSPAWKVFPLYVIPLIGLMMGFGIWIRSLAKDGTIGWCSAGALYAGIGAALLGSALRYFKKKLPS
ncbi:MAG: hypothetical protein AB7F75_03035 [Planctomycetota bacterium]